MGANFRVEKITPSQWEALSKFAHESVFGKIRGFEERISYAWLVVENDKPSSYVTVLELDGDTAYWQFGGAFQWAWNSRTVAKSYDLMIASQEKLSRRIATRIENTNTAMLKLALSRKFLPIGIRTYQGSVLLELVRERTDNAVSNLVGACSGDDAASAKAARRPERK